MHINAALFQRPKVEQFRHKHCAGPLTYLFTEIVGSSKLKQNLGNQKVDELIELHHQKVRAVLATFSEGEEINTEGDSFFIVFTRPSDAVQFSLLLQSQLRKLAQEIGYPLYDRIGIHVEEVFDEAPQSAEAVNALYSAQTDACARVMSLGQADQILMSRFAFDNARQVFNGQNQGLGPLSWLNYGAYKAEGIGNPIEICEVGEPGKATLAPPSDSDKAKRHADSGVESVSGWRPATGQKVPKTNWILEKKLGESSFGEVWMGRHTSLKEPQAFKFYFRADRVRSLKRELIDINVFKEMLVCHPNIVGVREAFFDEPPYYLTMDFVNGVDLQTWGEAKGGLGRVPLAIRLDIAEQVANGLQAAHGAGILHRCIKPSNILIVEDQGNAARGELPKLQVKLTDIGLSHPLAEVLPGMSRAPTGSMPGNPSSAQQYLAPELLTGAKASIGSDIYALGVMLYQLLTGNLQQPAPNNGAEEVTDPQLRKDLEHCFAGKPEERLASVKQLAGSLHDVAEQHRYLAKQQAENAAAKEKASRRRRMQVAALAVLSAVALLALALLAINAFKNAGRFNTDRPEAVDKSALRKGSSNSRNIQPEQGALRAQDHSSELANLARVLHADPSNQLAAEQIMSLLSQRDMALPKIPQLKHAGNVCSAPFSPDGQQVVTASEDGTARVWDTRTGQPVTRPLKHDDKVTSAQFSPDGQRVMTASEDGTARVWDTRTGQPVTRPLKHDDKVTSAQFSPDGQRVVTASDDGTARVWDTQTGQPVTIPLKHDDKVAYAQFSPDGQQVVTASEDGTARVWNTRTGQPATRPLKHDDKVAYAQFSPDGQQVVTASDDNTARVWDVRTGQPATRPLKHDDNVTYAQFSPEGLRVVTASDDNTARAWDAMSGKPLTEPIEHEDKVRFAQFSPDGLRVVTASDDNTARVWDVQTGKPLTDGIKQDGKAASVPFSLDGQPMATDSKDNAAHSQGSPHFASPFPSWLANLAETVAGRRINERQLMEPTSGDAYFKLKKQIENDPSTNAYTVWAKWFLADRSTRMISPFPTTSTTSNKLTIPDYIEQYLPLNNEEALLENGWLLAHPLMMAGTALYKASSDPTNQLQASLLAKTALAAEPGLDDPDLKAQVRYWLSRYAMEIGKTNEAQQHIQAALKFADKPARYWLQLAELELAGGKGAAWLTNMIKACNLAEAEKNNQHHHPETSRLLEQWKGMIGAFEHPNEQKAAQTPNQNDVILSELPCVDVPLSKIIENLLNGARVNATIDPRLLTDRDGNPLNQPLVRFNLKNVTHKQALTSLLMNHNCDLIPITPERSLIKPKKSRPLIKNNDEVAAKWERSDPEDKIEPEIIVNNAPLPMALESLFASAGLNVIIYSKLLFDSDGKTIEQPVVTMKLEHVTAKQAIAQLLKKYNYELALDTNTGIALITARN